MSVFGGIGKKLGKLVGGKLPENHRASQIYNLADADSLAMVFKLESQDQYKWIMQYLNKLKQTHNLKQVMAFAYVEEKEVPDYIKSRVDFEFFAKKEVNWKQQAQGSSVENFVQ